MSDFGLKLKEYSEYFDLKAEEFFGSLTGCPNNLLASMKYSFFSGGKRLRPALLFTVAEALGLTKDSVLKYALAVELIHNYSLIHDDLPAMDNDDYRRGKLTSHKKFGEAMAVLTGDALLNLAYEVLFSIKDDFAGSEKAKSFIAECAGINGMIKGQVYDIFGAEEEGINGIYSIIDNKTSALISAAVITPALLVSYKNTEKLKEYSKKLGEFFQISDDILDYEGDPLIIGKDVKKDGDKNTFINKIGIEETKTLDNKIYTDCKNILNLLPGFDLLSEATDYIYNRKK